MQKQKGDALLGIARKSILYSFDGKDIPAYDLKLDKEFKEKKGVFVTLTINDELRGCIGFPMPFKVLYKAVIEAARAAAFEDPRFRPLTKDEFNDAKIEISVLTKPQEIKETPERILEEIEIGKDGLIIEYSGYFGLLLPQVATENKWNSEKFLEQTCIKAGVSPKTWKNESCRVSKFQAEIFSEE
jgi:hypothetical protein